MNKTFLMLFLLPFLMVADIGTTMYGLNHGARELNPFFPDQNLFGKVGWMYLGIIVFALAYDRAEKEKMLTTKKFIITCIGFITILYSLVVFNNIIQIARMF